MLVLLPPSETKREGGDGAALDVRRLACPELSPQRDAVATALVALSTDPDAAARVLKLSPRQRREIAVNAELRTAPTRPAVDRYTGVLYDALEAGALDAAARRWLGAHVLIQSSAFGLVGALDAIPAYRLSAGVRLPLDDGAGVAALKDVWADAGTRALAAQKPAFVLDLRSEAYAALSPVPAGIRSVYVRVVAAGPDGAVRALNHFNKKTKGTLVRALARDRPRIGSLRGFERWATGAGFITGPGAPGELALFAP